MGDSNRMQSLRTKVSDFLMRRVVDIVGDSDLIYTNRKNQAPISAPDDYGLRGFEERFVSSEDGSRIGIWYKPPANPDKPTYVAFHGRTGHWGFAAPEKLPKHFTPEFQDNAYRVNWLKAMANDGAGVVAVHTRGFGLSANPTIKRIDESALKQDMDAVDGFLQQEKIDPRSMIITGESLGGAMAGIMSETLIAKGRPAGMLALINTFSDMSRAMFDLAVGHKIGPLQPLKWATEENLRKSIKDPLRTSDRISELPRETKLYIAHAPEDEVVFPHHSKTLLSNAQGREMTVAFRSLVGEYRTDKTRNHCAWNAEPLVKDIENVFKAMGQDKGGTSRDVG